MLASYGTLYGGTGFVEWRYIQDYEELQRQEGLHAATKFKKDTLSNGTVRNESKLAVQVLSRSMAKALEYPTYDLNYSTFEDGEANVKFVRYFLIF